MTLFGFHIGLVIIFDPPFGQLAVMKNMDYCHVSNAPSVIDVVYLIHGFKVHCLFYKSTFQLNYI